MKILLANLGNRNINFRGKLFSDCSAEEKLGTSNFRSFTKVLLTQYEEFNHEITLNILPNLISNQDSAPDKLFLFYTDSPQEERNDQDTIYEGDIVEKKLKEQYPNIEITKFPLKCRPTNSDEMMKRYRMYLRNIIKNTVISEVIICESGGTPQQKFALKIISEFLFDAELLKSFSVEVGKDKINIVQQPSIEYKNIIVEEQVSALITTGDFSGALTLMKYKNSLGPNKKLLRLLELSHFLMKNDLKKAKSVLSGCGIENFNISEANKKALGSFSIFSQSYIYFDELISENDYLTSCVLLSIGEWKLNQHLYGEASLFYSIFIENYLSAVINYAAPSHDVSGFGEKFDRFINAIQNGEIFEGLKFPEYIDIQKGASVPFKIVVSEHIKDEVNQKIVVEIKQVNSHIKKMNGEKITIGLDTLRNKYAHEGRHISEDDFKPFLGFCNEIHALFRMPNQSIFDILINSSFELMI